MQSDLSLEALASILSEKLFGGLVFGGRELEIHEEVPAVFIDAPLIGMKIVLDAYSGLNEENYFTLSISPFVTFVKEDKFDVRIDEYLICLLKDALHDIDNIRVIE
jgi:hypothetical protein